MTVRLMIVLLFLLNIITWGKLTAQTITNGDGTPIKLDYCHADLSYKIAGVPAGGSFTGCGISQVGGEWFFNPVEATVGITVFPVQCALTYTVGGNTAMEYMLIYKPVVIHPPLTDTSTCTGDIFLHAETLYAGEYDYVWTPGSFLENPTEENTNGFINASQTFVVTATDVTSGCMGSDTVVVNLLPTPPLIVSNDTTVLARSRITLSASGADHYQWTPPQWLDDPAAATPVCMPQDSITYTVKGISKEGCTVSGAVHINIIKDFMIPNAFSPNGDGLNDEFKIVNFGYQKVKYYKIFNRWGQEVFSTQDGSEGWDGNYNGSPAETGTYHYFIEMAVKDGNMQLLKGFISLLR